MLNNISLFFSISGFISIGYVRIESVCVVASVVGVFFVVFAEKGLAVCLSSVVLLLVVGTLVLLLVTCVVVAMKVFWISLCVVSVSPTSREVVTSVVGTVGSTDSWQAKSNSKNAHNKNKQNFFIIRFPFLFSVLVQFDGLSNYRISGTVPHIPG